MTEYWVSKKQYWCKYCSIFIRDDAPSKKHHETGLKHIGNRERYIRDLYKTGNKAKLDRAEEAAELAKIEAAALKSGDTATKLTLLESLRAKQAALRAGGHKARDSGPKDKFANYTSAADLGLRDEETQKTEYEIEQELKGRAGDVGDWETVDYEPTGAYTGEGANTEDRGEGPSSGSRHDELYGAGEKRKLGQYDIKDEDDHEDFDFIRRQEDATVAAASLSSTAAQSSSAAPPPKRKPRLDPYDEDDWDPRAAIKGKVKSAPGFRPVEKHVQATNLDRESWTGKLDFKAEGGSGMVYKPGGGWVKAEGAEDGVEGQAEAAGNDEVNNEDRKPDISHDVILDPDADSAPAIQEAKQDAASPAVEPVAVKAEPELAAGGMFKKRRPPPSSRKK